MTKHENHLFCRIAVHNQLVSLEDANACLREALSENRDVGEFFVAEGLLTEKQAAKIRHAVARKKGAGPKAERPARERAQAEPPPRERREPARKRRRDAPARPQNTNQLVLTISSFVVLLVVVVVFVIVWTSSSGNRSASPEKENPAAGTSGAGSGDNGGASLLPGGSSDPSAKGGTKGPAAVPLMSEEEKEIVEDACNKALSDAVLNASDRAGYGVASLDNFMKEYGDRATPEQKERIASQREKLIGIIKRKFAVDKERLLTAKDKGEAGEIMRVLKDIEFYADKETLKEAEGLVR
jgi:hypothetical protein